MFLVVGVGKARAGSGNESRGSGGKSKFYTIYVIDKLFSNSINLYFIIKTNLKVNRNSNLIIIGFSWELFRRVDFS